MHTGMYALIAIAAVVTTLGALNSKRPKTRKRGAIKAKDVLTRNEQPMYLRLREALPEHIVLCQVAFSAMLDTKDRMTRNSFSQKVADFVICKKSFEVLAVIELDDSSHKGREENDRQRDALLQEAGYRVVRYKTIPNVESIRNEINSLM